MAKKRLKTSSLLSPFSADSRPSSGRYLITAAISLVTAAIVVTFPEAALGGILLGMLVLAAVLLGVRTPHTTKINLLGTSVAGLVVVLTSASVMFQAPAHQVPPNLRDRNSEIVVTFDSAVHPLSTSWGATVHSNRFRANATAHSCDGHECRISLTVIGPLEDARWGETWKLTATLLPSQFPDPLHVTAIASEAQRESVGWGLLQLSESIRANFRSQSERLDPVAAQLLPGLAIGDTRDLGPELSQAMRDASLTHLTAVSGANCAIVVLSLWALARMCGASRRVRVAVSLTALALFVILVTPEPSVIRAATMAAIGLLAVLSGRTRRASAVLSLAVLLLVVADPWLARDFGFLLSVAATAGLLFLTRPLQNWLRPAAGDTLSLWIAVPLAAQLACAPVLVLLNPVVSPWSVPVNLLAAWLAPAATILGVCACVVLPVFPILGWGLLYLAALPAALIGHLALTVSRWPGVSVAWLPGIAGALTLALFLVLSVLAFRTGRVAQRARVALAGFVCLVAVLVGVRWGALLSRPGEWIIAVCPVGQGDALLVRSNGAVALIDTGPDPTLIRECLEELNVNRVTLLVLTHYDQDHIGGLEGVLGRVDDALVGPPAEEADFRVREALRARGARVHEVSRGHSGQWGLASWKVLWPSPTHKAEPGNDSSVIWQVTVDGLDALFLGDLGEHAQRQLGRLGVPRDIEVVKVAHHGSADQSAQFYRQLRAPVGLIGVGPNSYGHPTTSALSILRSSGTHVLRSDQDGLILLSRGAQGELRWWHE